LSNKKGEGDRVRKSLVKRLMKRLAIPLINHKTVAKWLVIAIPLGRQTALHSHSAKSPKDGDISRWLTPAEWLVILKLLCAAAALMLSTTVSAVGMGGINVASALGQPLKADIELVAIGKAEKDSLVARLASPETYKSAGLEYPYGNKFKFQIESRAGGEPYIKVSSAQPINDPFVSLLVELSWSSGKLSREYTFLLDPVDYVPVQPVQAAVQAVAPAVQAAESAMPPAASAVPAVPAETAATPAEQATPLTAITPAEPAPAESVPVEPVPVEQVPVEQAAASGVPAVPAETAAAVPVEQAGSAVKEVAADKEWVAVQRGDTLSKIAAQSKLADMSLERMLVALYRANAGQFDGKNMNRIRVGKILHLPSQDEYASVTQSEAVKEIHAQAADWNAYRQKLASAAPISGQPQAVQQIASGKITSSVADKAPVAKESAKEVLKLSKGEAPGDKAATGAGGKSVSAQDKKNAAQEDAIAKAKAVKEGQERAAMLEKNLQDMKRLAQLKSEAASLAQPPATAAPAAAPAKVAEASTVKPKPKEIKAEPSLVDQILDEPLYQGGAAAALLVLAGLGFMVYRRKKKPIEENLSETAEDFGSTTGKMAAPVVPSPDTGDFTRTSVTQVVAAPETESVDPISEADLFLNFGRDAQAEEILKEALQTTPNNHQIHLKLLGIYANRKDANSFSTIALQLQESGDKDAWQQAVAMGLKLEPGNPIYGGGGGGGFRSMEDTGSATMQIKAFNATPEPENVPAPQAAALDFDFDAGATSVKAAPSPERDFLGDSEKTVTLPAAKQASAMDFDITSTNPAMPAAVESTASFGSGDMVFDVTGGHPEAQPEVTKPADDGGMAFTLDFPVEKAAVPAPAAPVGLEGISLNFDNALAAASEPAAGSDQWQEVATKLDLAKAYQEMGDNDGAREILEEVMREGDAGQRDAAQAVFEQLA
jgi:pilus assembly protein FimV